MPEVDFRTARVKRNPWARRIAAGGLVVQVGRGRPRRLLESGGTTPRSVRFPDEIWALLEERAQAKGLTLHAALREAILQWARATLPEEPTPRRPFTDRPPSSARGA
jgi:hypothetical protein